MIDKYKFTAIISLFLFLLCNVLLSTVEINKDFEIEVPGEIQFYIIDDSIYTWTGGKLTIYDSKGESSEKVVMTRGEGPGDFNVIQKIYKNQDKFYFWDRMLSRITVFSDKWKLLKIERVKIPRISEFLGIYRQKKIFKWNNFNRENNRQLIEQNIGQIESGVKKSFFTLKGDFSISRILNQNRSFLITSFSGTKIYFADNQSYKIHYIDLNQKNYRFKEVIKKNISNIKWSDQLRDLKWEILKYSKFNPEEIYPKSLPPLYSLASDRDLLLVCTNEKILEKKSKIDIYRKNIFQGSITIPILYQQHLIFPSFLGFPPDLYLNKNKLYSFHYFEEDDSYKIIQWSLNFSS